MTRSHVVDKQRGERLGTVTQARDALGLESSADVWRLVVTGALDAVRDNPQRPTLWTIYDVRGKP